MILTEEQAIKIAMDIDKRLPKFPHTFKPASEVGLKGFDWVLSFEMQLEDGGKDSYDFYFGDNKSEMYPLKNSLQLKINITDIVDEILAENATNNL